MTRVILLAALPQEYGPLKKLVGPWRLVERRPFKKFAHVTEDKEILLVETGMGKAMVLKALEREVKSNPPDLLISLGFAGSLCEDFAVEDVLLGKTLIGLSEGDHETRQASSYPTESEILRFEPSPHLLGFCRDTGVRQAQIVTVARPESKPPLSLHFKDTQSLMDMESFHVARAAEEAGIPFLCFRAVSDGLHDEIDFDLDRLIDPSGRVRISAVLATVALHPGLVRSFYTSWRRSAKAARRLGEVLAALLRMDGRDLRGLGLHASFTLDPDLRQSSP